MTAVRADDQWLAEWRDWHAAREKAVSAPYGIAANTGTTWLSEDPQPIAGLPGQWSAHDGRAVNQQDGLALAPGQEHLSGSKLVKVVSPRPNTVALRVFDPDAPTRIDLLGIETFAPDPAWVRSGRFEPAPPGSTVAIRHVDGVTTADRLAGKVHADVAGHHLHLLAWPAADPGTYELTFADTTCGPGSSRFRFLKFAAPDETAAVELDFNRAFLPPCALGEGYLCPIPPEQNRLPIAVKAGERAAVRSSEYDGARRL